MPLSIDSQPVSKVIWVHRDLLCANGYNPNSIAPLELKLLKVSIQEDGWTMPIVVSPKETGRFEIIDGYHRWIISSDPLIHKMTDGLVPIVEIKVDPIHQKMSTIRHNRARGAHEILKMAEIVRTILSTGVSEKELMKRLGMESEEVKRLNNRAGMPDQISSKNTSFNNAWVPRNASSS